jgi:hypothetical protein
MSNLSALHSYISRLSRLTWEVIEKDAESAAPQETGILCRRCSDLNLDVFMEEVQASSIVSQKDAPGLKQGIEDLVITELDLGDTNRNSPCPLCRVFYRCTKNATERSFTVRYSSLSPYTAKPRRQGGDFYFYEPGAEHHAEGTQGMVAQYTGSKFDPCFRTLSSNASFTLLKQWIGACQSSHECCSLKDHGAWIPKFQISLINCETRCVETYTEGEKYVALSYVWGEDTSEVIARSGILPCPMPKLIDDAIEATKAIGLNYLWVDRYCISIDETIKYNQLKHMDEVYQHAELTIVSLAPNPSHGLPGVNNSRREPDPLVYMGDLLFTSSVLGPVSVVEFSPWATRAWTFQEGIFSRRVVCFTPEQMYFECKAQHLSEREVMPMHSESVVNFSLFTAFQNNYILNTTWLWRLIGFYTDRTLTYENDALNAFLGVLHAYETSACHVRHHWGIPIELGRDPERVCDESGSRAERIYSRKFAHALSWTSRGWSYHNGDMISKRNAEFPSWSWLGWRGAVLYIPVDICATYVACVWIELLEGSWMSLERLVETGGLGQWPKDTTPYLHLLTHVTPIELVCWEANKPIPGYESEFYPDLRNKSPIIAKFASSSFVGGHFFSRSLNIPENISLDDEVPWHAILLSHRDFDHGILVVRGGIFEEIEGEDDVCGNEAGFILKYSGRNSFERAGERICATSLRGVEPQWTPRLVHLK